MGWARHANSRIAHFAHETAWRWYPILFHLQFRFGFTDPLVKVIGEDGSFRKIAHPLLYTYG